MPIASDALYQLVYVSSATLCEQGLPELLRASRRRNLARGVTGMLLLHAGAFLQALEGRKQEVLRLYARIERDPRHASPRVLLRDEVARRSFAWPLGFYRTTPLSADELEGCMSVLSPAFAEEVRREPALALRALLRFREGPWERRVDAGELGSGSAA
jgi:hypothetical protein